MHTELYYSCGFVISSKFRESVMKSLSKSDNTPTNLSKLNDMNIVHISNALQQLKKRGLVVCLNEKDRMNRIYSLTEMGWKVVNFMRVKWCLNEAMDCNFNFNNYTIVDFHNNDL